MYIGDLDDLKQIVYTIGNNYNYVVVDGMWDHTFTCIFCNKCSLNSSSDIKHSDDCVSRRLIQLYDILDKEIYKMEIE